MCVCSVGGAAPAVARDDIRAASVGGAAPAEASRSMCVCSVGGKDPVVRKSRVSFSSTPLPCATSLQASINKHPVTLYRKTYQYIGHRKLGRFSFQEIVVESPCFGRH